MIYRSAVLAAGGLCLALTVAHAQGGPPLETDDPGTLDRGRWELNLAVTLERSPDGTIYEAPLGDVNYGLGERIQLKLEIPLQFQSGDTRAALGNPLVGVKWRFLEDSSSRTAVSTYPQLEIHSSVLVPDDTENEPEALLLPIQLAREWGEVGVNAEVGYRIVKGTSDELFYGLALGYRATGSLELLTECNGSSDHAWAVTQLLCQLGARYEVAKHFSLLGASGTGVAGVPAERRQFHLYLGLQSRW